LNISKSVEHACWVKRTNILPGSLVIVTHPCLIKTQLGVVISVHDWRGPLALTPVSFGIIKLKYVALA
jgi:hypothetical protein